MITAARATAGSVWAHRSREFERCFGRIAATRMAGLPVLNRRLSVQMVGLAGDCAAAGDLAPWAWGVLITPWFMNLLHLPATPCAAADVPGPDRTVERDFGGQRWALFGAHEPQVGGWEAVSLFSPMHEFADQASAVATAQAVLAGLRSAAAPGAAAAPLPSRRGFLLGRRAEAGA